MHLTLTIMDFVIVSSVALFGACLSFFCGFGMGTLLLPAFLLFFPPEIAIAGTAVVHMLNNVFKLFLVGKHANWKLLAGFGTLSVCGALIGAFVLKYLTHLAPLFSYHFRDHLYEVGVIQFTVACVIFLFSILEIAPWFQALSIPKKWMPAGGLLSGFFGGLSGHQGALRSAFLMKAGLSKEAFMGTRVVCACLVDLSRISVYATDVERGWKELHPGMITAATLAAFLGAWLGNKWVKKVELPLLNRIISIAMMVFALALGAGWI